MTGQGQALPCGLALCRFALPFWRMGPGPFAVPSSASLGHPSTGLAAFTIFADFLSNCG